jgi:hypothetical protein
MRLFRKDAHFQENCTKETVAILRRFKGKAALSALTDHVIFNAEMYKVARESVNCSVKCTTKALDISLILTELIKVA